jgi:hypothetical protein
VEYALGWLLARYWPLILVVLVTGPAFNVVARMLESLRRGFPLTPLKDVEQASARVALGLGLVLFGSAFMRMFRRGADIRLDSSSPDWPWMQHEQTGFAIAFVAFVTGAAMLLVGWRLRRRDVSAARAHEPNRT